MEHVHREDDWQDQEPEQAWDGRLPHDVYLWTNQMVMVCDAQGEQIPAFQGHVDDVEARITPYVPRSAWHVGAWWGPR